MVNDPDRDERPPRDRDPAGTGRPAEPADPWVMDAETILHRHDSGYPPGGNDATQVAGPRPGDDATRVQPAAEPPHWVARANVNPAGPRSAMPRAWQESETVDEP